MKHVVPFTAIFAASAVSVSAQTQTELPIGANNCAIAKALNATLPIQCIDPPLGQERGIVIRLDSQIRKPSTSNSVTVKPTKVIAKPVTPKAVATTPISHKAAKSENGYYIHFALNSFELEPEYKTHLERLATVLTSAAMMQSCLLVTGHTDTTGPAEYNQNLSEKRAVMVATYLSDVGNIDPMRIQISAAGETKNLPDISGRDSRNRRVEFSTKDTLSGCT